MSDLALPPPIEIEKIPVHPVTKHQLVETIVAWSRDPGRKRLYNVNVHAMNIANREPRFRQSLQKADLVYCDGVGVLLAARALGRSLPERLSVMDWLDEALAALSSAGSSVFLLGDHDDVVRQAADRAINRHPELQVAGFRSGYFDSSSQTSEDIVSRLRSSRPNVVFVGMGMPRQEFWIDANLDRLPPAVYVPVGAAFRWYSGVQRRPSATLRVLGLEWLGRLIMEPRRLWRRYLIGNSTFVWRITRDLIRGSR